MLYSMLLSSIIRGTWFIREEDALSHAFLVEKMLSGNSDQSMAEKLSDRKPFIISLDSGDEFFPGKTEDCPEDRVAIISLSGTMLKFGTYCSYGTEEVAAAIRTAADAEGICGIVIKAHSGGGALDSIAPVFDAITYAGTKKPVVGCVDLCASACYYGLLPCDAIMTANDISAEIGSIGVMCSFMDVTPYYEKMGVKIHRINSSLSEYKNRPFHLALEGKYDEIRAEEMDPLAKAFQDNVKKFRAGKLDESVAGILNGRMFFAADALKYGLIDEISSMEGAIAKVRMLAADRVIKNYY